MTEKEFEFLHDAIAIAKEKGIPIIEAELANKKAVMTAYSDKVLINTGYKHYREVMRYANDKSSI